jgi:hypothetical protein
MSRCSALCGGVTGKTEKKAWFSYPAVNKVFTWQKITKMTGAHSPLSVKNFQNDTWDVMLTGLCAVYVSFKFCVLVCPGVTGCYSLLLYYFFMSYMT